MKNLRTVILAFAVAIVLMAGAGRVLAIDHSLFELDGDAMDNPSLIGDDWDLLYGGKLNPPAVFAFVSDPAPKSIFTGGGSKDIYDISSWKWKDGSVPDKDNITNAYATAYIAAADNPQDNIEKGDLLVYFGCDRFAINGDAFLGFWFFQNRITLHGTTSGTFDGLHETGDVLILVDFPQGTRSGPMISVIKWNPANPTAASNLELIAVGAVPPGSAAVCSTNDEACATTNLTQQPSPWPYTPKSGSAGTFPAQAFFEGGINLTQLLGSTECFSSFLCESRSSEQFTATLKDFVLGQFPVCGISITKACQVVRLTTPADDTTKHFVVEFEGDVTNTGAASIPAGAVLTVLDDAGTPNNTTDDVIVTVTLVNDLLPGGTVHFSSQFFSDSNPPLNTVNASIAFQGTTISAEPFTIECTKLDLNPVLTLDKSCTTKLVTVGDVLAVQVDVTITVSVGGNVPLTVTASDPELPPVNGSTTGNVLNGVLMNPGDTQTINLSYLPTQANGGEDNPCTAAFSDTVSAIGTSDVPGVDPVTATPVTANCSLCDCE